MTISNDNNVRIERIEGTAMAVNSYVIDGPTGLVVVDGQLTVSDAHAVRRMIDGFGRPVAALVLTHPHPDHYAGAATILDGLNAPIVATSSVAAVIVRDDAEKDSIVGPMMGAEWPSTRRFPDEVIDPGQVLRLGGLEFGVRDVGSAESGSDTLWSIGERTVFCGDIAYNDMHPYLLDGHFRNWLALLESLDAEFDNETQLFVGHGSPTNKSVLSRQAQYVQRFIDVVRSHIDSDVTQRHDAVVKEMRTLVSDDRLLFLMELSIEPALAVLRNERP